MAKAKLSKSNRVRVDEELVRRGLADTLRLAQARILSGEVIVADQRVDKVGSMMDPKDSIRVKDKGRFVSRGGDKLLAAIQDFSLENCFEGKLVADVGASTGGFTDCCLQLGARKVIAIDVGTNQLAWSLRNDPRVEIHEQTDIRAFDPVGLESIDWLVADLSFTSLSRLIPDLVRLAPNSQMLLLVKPQFELPRDQIPAGGVVDSDKDRATALLLVESALLEQKISVLGKKDARIEGRAGNREIFIWCRLGSV